MLYCSDTLLPYVLYSVVLYNYSEIYKPMYTQMPVFNEYKYVYLYIYIYAYIV